MPELFTDVVGQEAAVAGLRAAVASPVHAYLLVGPAGVGKRAAARSFAASLLCSDGGCGHCRHCLLALAGSHPDLAVFERSGASITVDEAREVARLAARTPVEARRRVLVLTDIHLVERAAPALLKTIEEPPPTTVFVLLADHLAPDLMTIASRCAIVELGALPADRLVEALESEGAAPETAQMVAAAAGGRLDRARLLVSDGDLATRHGAWRSVPSRLDGTGATVANLVDELLSGVEGVGEALRARQEAEVRALVDSAVAMGERGLQGRAALEARHKREQRRARVDDLRAGLAALAGAYRASLDPGAPSEALGAAIGAIDQAGRDLDRNPNEVLWLQALLLRLSAPATLHFGEHHGT